MHRKTKSNHRNRFKHTARKMRVAYCYVHFNRTIFCLAFCDGSIKLDPVCFVCNMFSLNIF